MKVESRGKYPGVKLHLEPEEIEIILTKTEPNISPELAGKAEKAPGIIGLVAKMARKIRELQEKVPDLLQERTPEQVKAILVKEVEKAAMQLKMVEAGQDPSKVDKEAFKAALLKYVKD